MSDLELEAWQRLSPSAREAAARSLVRQLPDGFHFRCIKPCSLGDRQHEIAEFIFQDASFMLIPGGEVVLGYDADRPWEPTPEELESWQKTVAEYGYERTIQERIAEVTRRPKTVNLRAFLIETNAYELGWESLSADDPALREALTEFKRMLRSNKLLTVYDGSSGGCRVRLTRTTDGAIQGERAIRITQSEIAAGFAKAGCRFPTTDEWEYTCGAGAPTLFRWGDHVPCNCYPTDISADWDFHRRPNAFGIHVASDPYKYELVAEPDDPRGADGGATICGGMGFFAGWLPLATAFFDEACRDSEPDDNASITHGYTIGRRVLPLA